METNLRLECRDLGATSVVTPRDPEPMLKRGVGEAMRCGSDSAWTAAPADLESIFNVTSVPEGGEAVHRVRRSSRTATASKA